MYNLNGLNNLHSLHSIMVYGIKETHFKTILHPDCLTYPVCIYPYEMLRNEILIPVYGIRCDFNEEKGVCIVTDTHKNEIQTLYERLVKCGKNVKIGFFPVFKVSFEYRYKTYVIED